MLFNNQIKSGTDPGEADLSRFTFEVRNQPRVHPNPQSREPDLGDAYQGPGRNLDKWAPGWQKRAAIGLTGMSVFVGGLLWAEYGMKRSPGSSDHSQTKQGKTDGSTDSGNTRIQKLSTILIHSDEALELAKKGLITKEVYEQEGSAGLYSYIFTEAKQTAGAANSKLYLRGVQATERVAVLESFRKAGLSIVPKDPSSIGAESSGFGSLNLGTVLTGVIAFSLVAGLLLNLRSQRQAQSPLGNLVDYKGETLKQARERLADVGGLGHVVDELQELVADIRAVLNGDPNVQIPKGILLCGPPGTGKTLLARALAGELQVPFRQFDSSRFIRMLVGTGPANVESMFTEARKLRDEHTRELLGSGKEVTRYHIPNAQAQVYERAAQDSENTNQPVGKQGVCIIFLDEFDSIGSSRGEIDALSGGSERQNVVNALLNQMDGLNQLKNKNIIVIGATNFRDRLDSALLRPGRFTKLVDIPLPSSSEQRLDILTKLAGNCVYKRGYSFGSERGLAYLAEISVGSSGDDLRGILEESVALTRRAGRTEILEADLFEAFQRQRFGRIQARAATHHEQHLTLVHELGHAIVALSRGVTPLVVSSAPRGNSLGRVMLDPRCMSEILATKGQILSQVLIAAAGRAAELEHFDDSGSTIGNESDIEQSCRLIAKMISTGMLEDHFALRTDRVPRADLPPEQIELINRVSRRALQVAQAIVSTAGVERVTKMASDLKGLNRELVGAEAEQFIKSYFNTQDLLELRKLGDDFIRNPLLVDK